MEQVTIKEIAKICGVGVSTVSRAMNDHPDVNPETKQKIMETIRKYRYVPNNSARNLKRTDSNTIAVLVKGITNLFFSEMIEVFEKECYRQKYTLVLQHVEQMEDEVDVAIQLEKEKRLQGVIFLGGMLSHSENKLHQLTTPFVVSTVNPDDFTGEVPAVTVDDTKESRKIVNYLIGLGHRRIAILTPGLDDVSIGAKRLAGYKEAFEENQVEFDEKLVRFDYEAREKYGSYSIEYGYQLAKDLLAEENDLTCIYAISDTMAIGASKAIFESGRKIPDDISVAGFDGMNLAAFYEPSITTLCQPRKAMAKATIDLLFALIKGEPAEKKQIFEGKLIVGGSTREI